MYFIVPFFWLFGYAGGNGHFESYLLENTERESTNTMYIVYVLAVITV
jgi:hypothetical protein